MTGILCSFLGAKPAVTPRTAITVTANGNAQVDTAQSYFGGASALFDGTTDSLDVAYDASLALGSGSWTIENWIRLSALTKIATIYDFRPNNSVGNYPFLRVNTNGSVVFNANGDVITSASGVISTGTWYHVAVCKSGSSTKMFVNGTQVGSTYTDNITYLAPSPRALRIGDNVFSAFAEEMNGHMDEFRISNSARYTTTFTPSTTAFVNDSNTLLLLHMDGTDGSTVFTDDNA